MTAEEAPPATEEEFEKLLLELEENAAEDIVYDGTDGQFADWDNERQDIKDALLDCFRRASLAAPIPALTAEEIADALNALNGVYQKLPPQWSPRLAALYEKLQAMGRSLATTSAGEKNV